jgi:hypothetical protein
VLAVDYTAGVEVMLPGLVEPYRLSREVLFVPKTHPPYSPEFR